MPLILLFILASIILVVLFSQTYLLIVKQKELKHLLSFINLINNNEKNNHTLEILNYSKDPVVIINPSDNQKIVFTNKTFNDFIGLSSKKLVNSSWHKYIHPSERREMTKFLERKSIDNLINNNKQNTIQYQMINSLGEWIFFEGSFSTLNNNLVMIISRNVNSRKELENSLIENQKRYQYLTMNFPYGIFQLNIDTHEIKKANLTMLEILDCKTMKEIEGHPLKEFFCNSEQYERFLQTINKKQYLTNMECEIRQSSGKIIYCQISARLIHSGKEVILNGIINDISKQKQLEDALRLADIAKDATMAKNEFIASLSHDLRTPLNAIVGMSNLLRQSIIDSSQHEYIDIIQHSTESLISLIDDILDFSTIEAGKLQLEPSQFNIRDVLDASIDLLTLKASEKNIELYPFIHHNIPTSVIGDGYRLRQILVNLISNAIKYTNAGEVNVEISVINQTESSYRILFEVSDTGIGIPKKYLQDIFNSFERIKYSGHSNIEGTGLGLAIVKRLTNMMGGEITCSSVEGKGSNFCTTLTFNKATNHTGEFNTSSFLFIKKRILIVNYNDRENAILVEHLKYWGSRYHVCKKGKDVVPKLLTAFKDDDRYEVVIINQEMPDVKSIEIARQIKENFNLKTTKLILFVSFKKQKEINQEGLFESTLTKPIRISHLKHSIEQSYKSLIQQTNGSGSLVFMSILNKDIPIIHRILLVEDNPINQQVMEKILNQMGIDVHIAADGYEAIKKFIANNYALIFMDIQMPRMDGIEAARRIRKLRRGKDIPIIALTAFVMNKDRDEAFKVGMNDYLTKPININELDAILSLYLKNHKIAAKQAVFNYEALVYRLSAGGQSVVEDSFVSRLIQIFLNQAAQKLLDLKMEYHASNLQSVSRIGHFLKGSSANISAERLSKIAASIEILAKDNNADGIDNQISFFETELEVFKEESSKVCK